MSLQNNGDDVTLDLAAYEELFDESDDNGDGPLDLSASSTESLNTDDDELLNLVLDEYEDEEVGFEFDQAQLINYDRFILEGRACECHGYTVVDIGHSIGAANTERFGDVLWQQFQDEPEIAGLYWVANWAAAQFYNLNPVFFERDLMGVNGMTINVQPQDVPAFVRAVGTLGELGAIPCHYLRKMYVDMDMEIITLYPDYWFKPMVDALLSFHNYATE